METYHFTETSQEALENAREIASNYGNQVIEPEHLLAALLQDSEGTVPSVLQKAGLPASVLILYSEQDLSIGLSRRKLSISWPESFFLVKSPKATSSRSGWMEMV